MSRFSTPQVKIELLTHPLCGEECRRIENLIKKDILNKFWNIFYAEIPFDSEEWRYSGCEHSYCVAYLPSLVILQDSKTKVIDGANGITAREIKDILKNDFGMEERELSINVDVSGEDKKTNWVAVGAIIAAIGLLAFFAFKK